MPPKEVHKLESQIPATTTEIAGGPSALAQIAANTAAEIGDLLPESKRGRGKALLKDFLDDLAKRPSLVQPDALETIKGMIADVDARLSLAVNHILHDPKFQRLEGSWRGLHHLVTRTRSGPHIHIQVMNITQAELYQEFRTYNKPANFEQGNLFRKMYTERFAQAGATPFGILVGDFYFDHSPTNVEILQGMARIAASAHAPFITGASPNLLGMDSWLELPTKPDIASITVDAEHIAWRDTQRSKGIDEEADAYENSKYVGLCMPRFLARKPYGRNFDPVEAFDFEESFDLGEGVDGKPLTPEQIAALTPAHKEKILNRKYCWANAAFAMAGNITRSFDKYRWAANIVGFQYGGAVDNLPLHTMKNAKGDVDVTCPTEVYLPDPDEFALSNVGLIPLCMWQNSGTAAFVGSQSLQIPKSFKEDDATASAKLGANLAHILSVCRFSHYLKAMLRMKLGGRLSADQIQTELNNWIKGYKSPSTASVIVKASQPLEEVEVKVFEDPRTPGFMHMTCTLKPHPVIVGFSVSMELKARMAK